MSDFDAASSEEDFERIRALLDQHALLIGQVNISWTMCQLLVFLLFYQLSGMTWENARAVFFALRADVQQREITVALASERLTGSRSPRKRVVAAISRLNELANERNAATHTMWSIGDDGFFPASNIIHNKALDLDNPREQFQLLDQKLTSAHGALLKASLAVVKHLASQRKDAGRP